MTNAEPVCASWVTEDANSLDERPNSRSTRRDVPVRPTELPLEWWGRTVTGPAVRHKSAETLFLISLLPRGPRNSAPTRADCSPLAQEAATQP